MENTLYVGIDVGATKSKICISSYDSEILNTFTSEGRNFREFGIKDYSVFLSSIIRSIEAKHLNKNLNICIGIAGCGDFPTLIEIEKKLKQIHLNHAIKCLPDSYIAYEDCTANSNSPILLVLGTGSVVLAKRDQKYIQSGGWGYLFESSNGSSSIGHIGLKYLTKIIDGKISDPEFFDAYSEFYNSINLTESIKSIYQMNSIQQNLAKASQPILYLWKQNHTKSVQLLNQFCEEISDNVCNVADKLNLNSKKELFICGGLIRYNPDLYDLIRKYLPDKIDISRKKVAPELGAIKILMKEPNE